MSIADCELLKWMFATAIGDVGFLVCLRLLRLEASSSGDRN